MAAVASCQWWLTFPTPFQCGIFDQACHRFSLRLENTLRNQLYYNRIS